MQSEKLYVPVNISLRREWWKGFGDKELFISGAALIVSVLVAVILATVIKASIIVCVLTAIGIVALTVTFVQKTESGLSMLDYILIIFDFNRQQQNFYYFYTEGVSTYEEKQK